MMIPISSVPCPTAFVQPSVDPAYDHVLKLVGFDRVSTPNHPVFKALAADAYTTFHSLFQLRRADVEAMRYPVCSAKGCAPVSRHLPPGFQSALLVPQGYSKYYQETYDHTLSPSDWLNTTTEDINQYIMSDEYMYFNNTLGSCTGSTTTTTDALVVTPIPPYSPPVVRAASVFTTPSLVPMVKPIVKRHDPPGLFQPYYQLPCISQVLSPGTDTAPTVAPDAGSATPPMAPELLPGSSMMVDNVCADLADIDPALPSGCDDAIALALVVSAASTAWDPCSAILYGELPRPEEAATHDDNVLIIEAGATSEKGTKLGSYQHDTALLASDGKATTHHTHHDDVSLAVCSVAQLFDPMDLNRGVDPDGDHGLTLLPVMAHVDPPPPPEPPPCTHHPPSCKVNPKDCITTSISMPNLCLTDLFDGGPLSQVNPSVSKDDPITYHLDFGEIKQGAKPSLDHDDGAAKEELVVWH